MTAIHHFLTDTLLPLTQPTGAYGPIPKAAATDPDEYRVTSLHKASSNPTAYAACDAIVCVQRVPATTPPLVNIILRPLVQPALNFAPVKYILYKGILESSLINGAEVAASANSDLTKAIWDVQAKKNASANTPNATPPSGALGVGLTAASPAVPNDPFIDEQPIDNLFYRTDVSFQLPVVKGGWSLGQFDKNGFGIEVLMEGLAFHHPLSLARQIDNKISVPSLIGSETDAKKFDHWHAKEQILGFMDPCAFYGSFFRAGVQAKKSGSVPFAATAGGTLYNDVLSPFANLNKAYLDIRNEHNLSLNYFKNYQTTTGTSLNSVTATNVRIRGTSLDYYGDKWPIMILVASHFASNTVTARNSFTLQLPVGDNPKPLIYVSQGYRDNNAKEPFPTELKDQERFFDDFTAPVGGHTVATGGSWLRSLTFTVPNIAGQNVTTPVSCYIKLKYFKQQQGATTVPTAIQSANYLDNLFYPLDLTILLDSPTKIRSGVYDEEIYVNAQAEAGLGFDFIGMVGMARDTDNTSFFLFPTIVRTHPGLASAQVSLSGETSNAPGSYVNLVALKYPLHRVRQTDLALSVTDNVPIAEFASDGNAAVQARFTSPDFAKFFAIVIANAAYDSWKNKAAATLVDNFRVYLGTKHLQAGVDNSGVNYVSFDLVLRGFVFDASIDSYKFQELNTDPVTANNIRVYAYAGA